MFRIVYLSAPPHGWQMLKVLTEMVAAVTVQHRPVEIIFTSIHDDKVSHFPKEYELGINFLGTYKIPATEIKKAPWLNFHPAPLPEYRGRNVAYHALLNGAEWFGATLHFMDEEYDTGRIVEVQKFKVMPYDTAGDLVNKSHVACKSLFAAYIPKIIKDGWLPSYEQKGEGKYYKKEAINDVVTLVEGQERRVRALTVHPKHHARLVIGGVKYKIVPEE